MITTRASSRDTAIKHTAAALAPLLESARSFWAFATAARHATAMPMRHRSLIHSGVCAAPRPARGRTPTPGAPPCLAASARFRHLAPPTGETRKPMDDTPTDAPGQDCPDHGPYADDDCPKC
jgi:hypothetical protein